MSRRTLHIGIVACSSEGAALCYRTICAEGAVRFGDHAHPEISIHARSLAEYVGPLERKDVPAVGALMLGSSMKLAAIGADFLICPDNTIHVAHAWVASRSPRPWLHIAGEVASTAAASGFRRLGILGTRWLVESEVYPAQLAASGIECVRPGEADREEVHRIIMGELVRGSFSPRSTQRLQEVIERLKAKGCDAVALACTELPLVLDDSNSALPTLDSPRLLARAALRRAAGEH